MIGMGIRGTKDARRTWFFLIVGAVIGLALGALVSVTTDVPLAPEVGLAPRPTRVAVSPERSAGTAPTAAAERDSSAASISTISTLGTNAAW
jgi:hypothetical protein